MNINRYVPFLINTLDTIVSGSENTLITFGGCVSSDQGNHMWMPEMPSLHVTRPILLEPQGVVSLGSNPPRLGDRFIAWRLRCPFLGECRRAPKHFCCHRACLGYGPASGSTLKKASRQTCPIGVKYDK